MSGKRILAGERRPGSAYGTRMEGRVCLCGALQALGGGTLGRGVVVGSVGANPRFWHHCPLGITAWGPCDHRATTPICDFETYSGSKDSVANVFLAAAWCRHFQATSGSSYVYIDSIHIYLRILKLYFLQLQSCTLYCARL